MIYRRSLRPFVLLSALFWLSAYGVSGQDLVHQVAKGETVYSISRLYQISQEELMRYNKIADASKLQAGMRLAIPPKASNIPAVSNNPPVSNPVPGSPPVTGSPAATSPAYSTYTVSKSDTLYSIARSRGVTLQALRDINGFSKNYVLKAGEKIKVPVSSAAPAAAPPKTNPATPTTAANAAAKKADTSIRWPVAAKEVLYMNSNSGVLVTGRMSESIKSLTGGIVVHASPWRGYGNVAVVEAEGGYCYIYGSCETLSVRKGDSIEPGTELGKLGIYPASGKPELVLIVSQNGSPVDPAKAPRY
jgi:LysM repeat protein